MSHPEPLERPEGPAVDEHAGPGRLTSIVFVAALLAIALLLAGFAMQMRRSASAPEPGQMAPDFELETFEGDVVRLTDLRGKVVVLNFWASWCVPCAVEAADLEELWRDYRDDGVMVLGIGYTDTAPDALAYLEKHDVTYPNGPDRADVISRRYHLAGVPETFVVDKAGAIVPLMTGGGDIPKAKIVGPVAPGGAYEPADLRALVDRLLAQESSE